MLTEQLRQLLTSCRSANSEADITGALLYRDGTFMQALEGPQEAVEAVFARIRRDPRHGGITVISAGETAERQFPDWSMAFRNLDSDDSEVVDGFTQLVSAGEAGPDGSSPTSAQRVLMSFRQSITSIA